MVSTARTYTGKAEIWGLLGLLLLAMAFCSVTAVGCHRLIELMYEAAMAPKPTPPPYHNAQQVEQRTDTDDACCPKGIISFITADKADTVQTFYRDFMTRVGWDFGGYAFDNAAETAYFQYWPDDGPVYKVLISAKRTDSEETRVLITMTAPYYDWHGEFWK